jgi:hypothetical protein
MLGGSSWLRSRKATENELCQGGRLGKRGRAQARQIRKLRAVAGVDGIILPQPLGMQNIKASVLRLWAYGVVSPPRLWKHALKLEPAVVREEALRERSYPLV